MDARATAGLVGALAWTAAAIAAGALLAHLAADVAGIHAATPPAPLGSPDSFAA